MAGGTEALLKRAKALKKAEEVQLALHLVDFVLDNPETADLKDAHELKAELLQAKAEQTTSFIAHNIFMNGARRESQVARELK